MRCRYFGIIYVAHCDIIKTLVHNKEIKENELWWCVAKLILDISMTSDSRKLNHVNINLLKVLT